MDTITIIDRRIGTTTEIIKAKNMNEEGRKDKRQKRQKEKRYGLMALLTNKRWQPKHQFKLKRVSQFTSQENLTNNRLNT